MREERLRELVGAIVSHLRDNPAHGASLVQACMTGMSEAVERARSKAGDYSVAMLCALSLADGKRISAEMREHFYKLIAEKIDGPGLSQIEREFVERGRAMPTQSEELSA